MARPLICGMFVGFMLGNPIQGIIYGSSISLPFLAYISAGDTVPMDPGLADTLGTSFSHGFQNNAECRSDLGGTHWSIRNRDLDYAYNSGYFFLHLIDKAAANAD